MWGSVETIRDLIPDIPPLDLMLAVCGDGEVYNRLLAEGMGGGGGSLELLVHSIRNCHCRAI